MRNIIKCNGEFVTINGHKMHIYIQGNKNAPAIVFMSGLEAIRWKQMVPEEVSGIIGIDMATPLSFSVWTNKELKKQYA